MLILGIETSCDETAAAVVRDGREVLSSIVASQDKVHQPYGGVVPELACRAHLAACLPVLHRALQEARVGLDDIEAVGVVHTPGLVGALLVGVTTAKTLAWVRDLPLVGVHHLHAHAYAAQLDRAEPVTPCVTLVASGGHTTLFHSRSPIEHEPLGSTLDDAAGEAFDKAASILGLGYPGGPQIDRVAKGGNPRAVAFPRAKIEGSLNFSFSGIKTAVLYHVRGQNARAPRPALSEQETADVAASFQEAVADTLVEQALEAVRRVGAERLVIGGGVAANSRLRARLQDACARRRLQLILPPMRYCIDNAAMTAGLAFHLLRAGRMSDLALDAAPTVRAAARDARQAARV